MLFLDIETYDPYLKAKGPGDISHEGYIVGIGMYSTQLNLYIPLYANGGRMADYEQAKKHAIQLLYMEKDICGANISYDLGWLLEEGFIEYDFLTTRRFYDVQIMAALVDEHEPTYKLAYLAEKYTSQKKWGATIEEECLKRGIKGDPMLHLADLPSSVVGEYCQQDCKITSLIYDELFKIIIEQQLDAVYNLEMKLIPWLVLMRHVGVPISYDRAQQAMEQLDHQKQAALDRLGGINVWSSNDIQRKATEFSLSYPFTDKGAPSFTADWLAEQTHPFWQTLILARRLDRAGGVFIKEKILKSAIRGRIHANYHQTRSDQYGTVSGRFSCSHPNMQQVPARDPVLAPLIRSCFVPDEGCSFAVFDYSQQEPRIGVHYAYLMGLRGAAELREAYLCNNKTDHHQLTTDIINKVSNGNFSRKLIKPINLAISYGMGVKSLAAKLGLTVPEASDILDKYNEALPYVMGMKSAATRAANLRGYVKTHLGRRARFPHGLGTHNAANRVIQGTGADMIKSAMLALFENGYMPYGTVHDEIDCPVDTGNVGQVNLLRDLMLDAMPLTVPMQIDVEIGASWGGVKEMM